MISPQPVAAHLIATRDYLVRRAAGAHGEEVAARSLHDAVDRLVNHAVQVITVGFVLTWSDVLHGR